MKTETAAHKEYMRRLTLCTNAIYSAATQIGMIGGIAAENFQGVELRVHTEAPATAEVIVIMITGHGPRFPKNVTLEVHGYIEKEVNRRVRICAGGLASSKARFLPENISIAWLKEAIAKAEDAVRKAGTAENMERLRKKALAKRRSEFKSSRATVYTNTWLKDLS